MFNVTLPSILKGFTKTINDLEGYVSKTNTNIESNNTSISELTEENTTLTTDKDRAERIVAKLNELIEV